MFSFQIIGTLAIATAHSNTESFKIRTLILCTDFEWAPYLNVRILSPHYKCGKISKIPAFYTRKRITINKTVSQNRNWQPFQRGHVQRPLQPVDERTEVEGPGRCHHLCLSSHPLRLFR